MTNKQHSINYTISKGIYGRNNQCRAKGERKLFFTETCAMNLGLEELCLVVAFIIIVLLRNTEDSISQSIPSLLLQAARVK